MWSSLDQAGRRVIGYPLLAVALVFSYLGSGLIRLCAWILDIVVDEDYE